MESKKAWELLALTIPLGIAAHFLWIRVQAAGFPSGDEGSWLAVAAQWARGEGFTTRWLEHHWLIPYALPRPDDFRFPGLILLLGGVFRLFGPSYPGGLMTVAAVFLAFAAAVFFSLRKPLGFWPAIGAASLTACSPLQLLWSAGVYTEGLFGLLLALWVGRAFASEENRRLLRWWAAIGAITGSLYLARPNGLLLFGGVIWQFIVDRRRGKLEWNRLAVAALACFTLMLPWLIRNQLLFGNPFHVAGSAGLLRDHFGESHTLGVGEYFSRHSLLFPLLRAAVGAWRFFQTLHFFEHGLEILPLAGLALGILIPGLRRSLAVPAIMVGGLGLSFAACSYAAFNSWAGVRYFSGFLPFVYGFGIFYALEFFTKAPRLKARRFLVSASLIALMLLPVVNPHRFYERKFRAQKNAAEAVGAHLRALEKLTMPGGLYYAKSLCQVNFLTDRRCVGLQELYDTAWFARSEAAFHPRLMALRRGEDTTADIREALGRYRGAGLAWDTVATSDSAFYLRLRAASHPP